MAMSSGTVLVFIIMVLCSAMCSCNVALAGGHLARAAASGDTVFNVLSFGAKPGSQSESTMAFLQAWHAACSFNGRARVFVPPGVYKVGETLFQGPCKSSSPVVVQVAGTLNAVADISEYSNSGWISFDSVNGLIVSGGGTLDGQGQVVWQYNDCKTNPNCIHLPAILYFNNVQNVIVKQLNLMNSMGFHIHVTSSYLVRFHSLTINSPPTSPNTDGIHISKSQTVKFSRSLIKTGDDCVSVGQGATNVTINQVTCGPGHGISVGSLGKLPGEKDVIGLIVKNCSLLGTTNGIRIKTYAGINPSRAIGMLFTNVIMDNVKNPIIIDQSYGTKSSKPSQVRISDVVYQNIRGTTYSSVAVNLMCSSQTPCQNVHLSNINLKHIANTPLTSTCTNAKVGYSGIQIPPPCYGHSA